MQSSRLGLAMIFLVFEACSTTPVGVGGPQSDAGTSDSSLGPVGSSSSSGGGTTISSSGADGSGSDVGTDSSSSDAGTNDSSSDATVDTLPDSGDSDAAVDAGDDSDDSDDGEIPDGGFFDVIPPPPDCRSLLCPTTLICHEGITCGWTCVNPKFPGPGPRPGTCLDAGEGPDAGDAPPDPDAGETASDGGGP
jgi:hypothetical protein